MFRGVIAALLLLVGAGGLVAAEGDDPAVPAATYPKLARHASSGDGFVPSGWRLESIKSGDLNGDGRPDLVLALRDNDPGKFIDTGRQSTPRFDTNPRILAVAFAKAQRGYDLALENHTLIARTTDSWQQDPLDPDGIQAGEVAIKNGTLRVTLGYFGGDMGRATLTFRYQNKRFELIGYDRLNVTRNSGVMTDTSVNFSTRRVERKVGSISDDKNKITRTRLPAAPLLTMEQVGDGLEYWPLKE